MEDLVLILLLLELPLLLKHLLLHLVQVVTEVILFSIFVPKNSQIPYSLISSLEPRYPGYILSEANKGRSKGATNCPKVPFKQKLSSSNS